MNLVITTLLGIFIGILLGLVGIPAYALMQILLLSLGIAPNFKTSIGIMLFVLILPTTLVPSIEYAYHKHLMIYTGIILTITIFIFSYISSFYTSYFTDDFLKYISGVIYLLAGLYIIIETKMGLLNEKKHIKSLWS